MIFWYFYDFGWPYKKFIIILEIYDWKYRAKLSKAFIRRDFWSETIQVTRKRAI